MSSPADAQTGLDEIISRGKIIVGIDLNVAPFGYLDEKQQPAGSEVETAKLIAKDLGVEMEIVQVTAANRVPYLVTDKVDVMLATFAISPERAKSVWFSTPYGATGSVLLGKKADSIASYNDLANMKVAVARGSFTEQSLAKNAPSSTEILRFDDDASATAAFMSGQADAYGTAFPIAATLAKTHPERELEIKFSMLTAWYGVGVKKGKTDLLQWLNSFMFFHLNNGDLAKIYEDSIGRPLGDVPHL
jgi:polar amino acid transport system substrate-binding protein